MLNFIKFITFFLAAVSAATTWSGFRSLGHLSQSEFTREVMPVLMALASLLAAVGLWFSLFDWYPKSDKETKRKLNLAIVIACAIIFGLSTIWSVMGLGGDAAIIHHMNKTIKKAEETLNILTGQVERETQMAASSQMLAKQFFNLSEMEEKGSFTSYAGRGEVVTQLVSLSQTLNNLEGTIISSIASRRKTIEEAKEEIFGLREIIGNAEMSLPIKMKYFGTKLATLNQLFQRIQSQQVARLAKEVSKQLGVISATAAPVSGTVLGQAQKEAIGRLNETVKSAESIMTKFTESGIDSFFELSPLTAIDIGNAVLRYAYVIMPAWTGAIALDYVPLLFLFILVWTVKQREEREIKKLHRELQKELET